MERSFKITNHNLYEVKEGQYHEYSMIVLMPYFESMDSVIQRYLIFKQLRDDIHSEVEKSIIVNFNSLYTVEHRYNFGVFVFDQEIATIMKLLYS